MSRSTWPTPSCNVKFHLVAGQCEVGPMIKDKHCFVAVRKRHHNVNASLFTLCTWLALPLHCLIQPAFTRPFFESQLSVFVQALTEESEAVADSTQFLKYKIRQPWASCIPKQKCFLLTLSWYISHICFQPELWKVSASAWIPENLINFDNSTN